MNREEVPNSLRSGPAVSSPEAQNIRARGRLLLLLLSLRQSVERLTATVHETGPERNIRSTPTRSSDIESTNGEDVQETSSDLLQQKYDALLEGAPDAVFIADSSSGKIIDANRAAATLFDTTVDDLIGRHQSDLHPPEELEKYKALFERHKEAAQEEAATLSTLEDGSQIYVVSDKGRRIPVEINASFVGVEGEELFVGIFRDITERKRREEKLKRAKQEAEEASRLKDALLTNVSHEVRTPITSIIGFSKILTQLLEGAPKAHAEKIYHSGQYLMKTINSVLELSKLESGPQNLDRRPVRLKKVMEWAVELLAPEAEKKQIDLETDAPESPVVAFGNQEVLNHIAENLLENAIKFTPEGGRVEIRVREEPDEAILEVEDTGIGMDPEEVPMLFKGFKQESEGLNREHEGVGLGLTIVKKLADALGAKVEIETEKERGTLVTVHVPQADPELPQG